MVCFSDNVRSIGKTPLIKLNRLTRDSDAAVLVKVEGRNPSYSVKSRVGAAMVWDAEDQGALTKGKTIVEPTSGNTGIALAFVGAAKGYHVILTMPETMSVERRKLLKFLGARLILTPGSEGMSGAIAKAEEMANQHTDYVMLRQFDNPANPAIHQATTGPEIWEDTAGGIDGLIAGVGTGGTITGISRYIKEIQKKSITTIAVEPENSPVISQCLNGKKMTPGSHQIQGIGAGFVPGNLDLSLIDQVECISTAEAFTYARRLALEEGILAGISSGAAVAAAIRLARMEAWQDKTLVAILPDSGERYLSTAMYADLD